MNTLLASTRTLKDISNSKEEKDAMSDTFFTKENISQIEKKPLQFEHIPVVSKTEDDLEDKIKEINRKILSKFSFYNEKGENFEGNFAGKREEKNENLNETFSFEISGLLTAFNPSRTMVGFRRENAAVSGGNLEKNTLNPVIVKRKESKDIEKLRQSVKNEESGKITLDKDKILGPIEVKKHISSINNVKKIVPKTGTNVTFKKNIEVKNTGKVLKPVEKVVNRAKGNGKDDKFLEELKNMRFKKTEKK